MARSALLTLATAAAILALNAAPATAEIRHPVVRSIVGIVLPQRVATAEPVEGAAFSTPGPYRYSEYPGGSYPWYGYGFGVPTYNWGYFGAHYRPMSVCHKGYYGDFTQWGYRRGY